MFDHDIASIYYIGRFKDENLSLVIRGGSMLYTTWNDHEFTRPHFDHMITEFDSKSSFPNEEHFFAAFVNVLRELALNFD